MSLLRVMIVDDNEGDQFLCQYVINQHESDIDIIEAYDGQNALELLENIEPPNVIFLDINMPRMDGFEFLEQYEKKYPTTASKIILLTSSVIEREMLKGRSFAVIDDYIEKPLSAENVVSVINNS